MEIEDEFNEMFKIFLIMYFLIVILIIENFLRKKKFKRAWIWSFHSFSGMSRFFLCFQKNGEKYYFKIYGKIYIKLKYFETEKIGEEFQIGCLDIKLKQFF